MAESDLELPIDVLLNPDLTPDQKLKSGFLEVCTEEQRDRFLGAVASGAHIEDAILQAVGQGE